MIWIISLILFLIEVRILFKTQYYSWDVNDHGSRTYRYANQNLEIKVWHVLVLFLGNLGYASIGTLILFIIIYLYRLDTFPPYSEHDVYWEINDPIIHQIWKILNHKL